MNNLGVKTDFTRVILTTHTIVQCWTQGRRPQFNLIELSVCGM